VCSIYIIHYSEVASCRYARRSAEAFCRQKQLDVARYILFAKVMFMQSAVAMWKQQLLTRNQTAMISSQKSVVAGQWHVSRKRRQSDTWLMECTVRCSHIQYTLSMRHIKSVFVAVACQNYDV